MRAFSGLFVRCLFVWGLFVWGVFVWGVFVWGVLAAGASAQAERASAEAVVKVLREFDGGANERWKTWGRATICHDPRFVEDGLGSVKIEPRKKDKFWGLAVSRVDARGAERLEAELYHTGDKPAYLKLYVEDHAYSGRGDRLSRRVDVQPGWNRMTVPLAGARTDSGRALDFEKPLKRIVIDRGGPKHAFHVDHLRLVVRPAVSARVIESRFRRGFRSREDRDRIAAIRRLADLPESRRVQVILRYLKPSEPVWIQKALFLELGRIQDAASVKPLLARYARARPPLKARLLDLLGSLKFEAARDVALTTAADAKAPDALRAVALRAAVRRGRDDVVPIVAGLAPTLAWPVRAAGIAALRRARTPGAVDVLIRALETAGHARLELDAYEALVDLTGQDFGYELIQWKGWWQQKKKTLKRLPPPSRKRNVRGGYATFYGVPVRGARLVFILDISGSMKTALTGKKVRAHIAKSKHLNGEELRTRLDLAKEELVHTLEQLPKSTSFAVGFFNDEVFWLHRKMVAATAKNVAATARRVRSMSAEQETNVYAALHESIHTGWSRTSTGREAGPDTIFLLSDGVPSVGEITNFGYLADAVEDDNRARCIRINTILVGRGGGFMLRRIARENFGVFVDVGG